METEKYLNRESTLFLESDTKNGVLCEMIDTLCRQHGGLEFNDVMEAILRREEMLSSRISERIAFPHAMLPGFGRPALVLGYSREGIPWDSPGDAPVNLVILSVCGSEYGEEHIAMMADIANTLRVPGVLERIDRADSPEKIYDILQKPLPDRRHRSSAEAAVISRHMLKNAESLISPTSASAVMVIADYGLDLQFLEAADEKSSLIVVSCDPGISLPETPKVDHLLTVPGHGLERSRKVKLAVLFSLTSGLLGGSDSVICLSRENGSEAVNVLEILDISKEFKTLLSLNSEIESGDISVPVFHRVLELAIDLAREGREGKPVGAIFILGDYQNVRPHCYQMVINPFRGYPENERNVLDPALEETLKEFSRVDGACLIRGDGIVMSIGAYIQPEDAAKALQFGLGARHAAAKAITMTTNAVSIVISESTRQVSIFHRDRLLLKVELSKRTFDHETESPPNIP